VALIHFAVPASSAAPISLYRGRALLSDGFGEQEQSRRVRRRRGISALDQFSI
jgi:hypothetical protein